MIKYTPCLDCQRRTPHCHGSCQDYKEWTELEKAQKQALWRDKLPDEYLRTSYVNYKHKAEGHKAIRMYIHK